MRVHAIPVYALKVDLPLPRKKVLVHRFMVFFTGNRFFYKMPEEIKEQTALGEKIPHHK